MSFYIIIEISFCIIIYWLSGLYVVISLDGMIKGPTKRRANMEWSAWLWQSAALFVVLAGLLFYGMYSDRQRSPHKQDEADNKLFMQGERHTLR